MVGEEEFESPFFLIPGQVPLTILGDSPIKIMAGVSQVKKTEFQVSWNYSGQNYFIAWLGLPEYSIHPDNLKYSHGLEPSWCFPTYAESNYWEKLPLQALTAILISFLISDILLFFYYETFCILYTYTHVYNLIESHV